MKNGLAHHPQYSLHHSNTITLHYSFLQLLHLPSLVSPTFITKKVILLRYCFSKKQTMTIFPLLHQLYYINHSFIQTVYFFIQYNPEDTLKPCWFLVKITINEYCKLDMEPPTTGDYHVTFLSRHLSNNHLCDVTFC